MTERTGAPLAARELPALLERVHASMCERREAIDDLNVFPVPDGDTGTNMTLTVRSGLEALRAAGRVPGEEMSRAVVRGAVRGARGNSGVILSQVVRAVVEVVTGHREVDAELYAAALERARELAYEAVAEPVEGTILTVISAAADAAAAAVARGGDLLEVSARVCEATGAAVQRTREQLAVLRDAGVVDAGALGFEVLVRAVHSHLTGEEAPFDAALTVPVPTDGDRHDGCAVSPARPFEVQYLLDADDDAARPLRQRLERLGDSVVVVAAGGLLNVHVHTDDVGAAIEAGLALGRPSDIEVTHFGDQIAARRAAREATVGAVAVLHGEGARRLAQRAGAVAVEGAAGALPSVADLVDAIATVPAAHVLLLPGHPNTVPTAQQAAALVTDDTGRRVDVVEAATTPPAVLAALSVLDPTAPPETARSDVWAAAEAVRAGEVVAAVREATSPIGPISAGQPLAVAMGEVVAATTTDLEALGSVCVALGVADAEVVTLLVGADVDDAGRAAAVGLVEGIAGGDVEVVDAGHQPARFWIGVE